MLARAAAVIRSASRPLIVAGGGVIYAEAAAELGEFAEATGIPVAETQAGKGSLPFDHPLALGALGSTGTVAANRIASEADVVIGIGTRYSDFTTASRTAFGCPQVRFVNVNVAGGDAVKLAGTPVVADAREALRGLAGALAGWSVPDGYRAQARDLAAAWQRTVDRAYGLGCQPPAQSEVIGAVNDAAGPRDVVVCAAGSMPGDLHKLWRTRDPKGYHVEYGYSCMGYEIAGGLGVKLAEPDREVYVLVGDGSYLMMATELVTAVAEGIKVIVVLVQNHGFASIGGLSETVGVQRFGTRYRYRDPRHRPAGRRRPAGGPGRERGEPRRPGAPRGDDRGAEVRAGAGQGRAGPGAGAHRDRPDDPRAGQRGVVGRPGRRGLRPRGHPPCPRSLREGQDRPAPLRRPRTCGGMS